MRHLFKFLPVGLAALALSGCNAGVATSVRVTSASSSSITLGVFFSGEAAAKIASTPSLQHQLSRVISSRLHEPVNLSVSSSSVSWQSTVTYQQVVANSDVTGISSAALTSGGGNTAKVTLTMVSPSALINAIDKGVAGQPASSSLATTMKTYTDVSVQVIFPGPATLVSTTGPSAQVSNNVVSIHQSLENYAPGTVVLTGSLSGSTDVFSTLHLLGAGIILVLLIWGGVIVTQRRREF